ncbi:hypothetical protein HGO34_02530 [Agrobacterium vitis]|uniref:site-2 protease family protein n=1 Tax=Agrobacterium vitis TaxID=373 RepID=UPI0018D243AE|nr:site-2 protease family protein [Agrobacterium vitis]MCM2438594.1 hypothetical protein [Agrobacterium vitis]
MTYLIAITLSFIASLILGTILHEVGHAFAARLGRLQLREIRIGIGRIIWQFQIKNIDIVLHKYPIAGLVSIFPPLNSERRLEKLIYLSGGLFFNFIFLSILFYFLVAFRDHQCPNILLSTGVVVQISIIFINAVPGHIYIFGRKIPNDGLQIFQILISRKNETEVYRKQYLMRVLDYSEKNGTTPIFNEASERVAFLIYWNENSLHGNFDDYLQALEQELDSDLSSTERILLIDALVTGSLLRDTVNNIENLDRWTAEALSIRPTEDTLKASRGSVLIELNKVGEGLDLFSTLSSLDPFNKCCVLAYEALAHYKMGHPGKAEAIFRQAVSEHQSLPPAGQLCTPLIKRIAKALGLEMDRT